MALKNVLADVREVADKMREHEREVKARQQVIKLREELERVGMDVPTFLAKFSPMPKTGPMRLMPGREPAVQAYAPPTITPTPTAPRPVPTPEPMRIEQAPLGAPERAAVERGELGGPPTGPTLTKLALAPAAPAVAAPVLAAQAIDIPRQKIGKPIAEALMMPKSALMEGLRKAGAPEPVVKGLAGSPADWVGMSPEAQTDALSFITDPVNAVFFPKQTVAAAKGMVRVLEATKPGARVSLGVRGVPAVRGAALSAAEEAQFAELRALDVQGQLGQAGQRTLRDLEVKRRAGRQAREGAAPVDFTVVDEVPSIAVPDEIAERMLLSDDPYLALERTQAAISGGGPPVHSGRTIVDSGGTDPSIILRDMFDRRGLPTIGPTLGRIGAEAGIEPQMVALHRKLFGRFNEWATQERRWIADTGDLAKGSGYRRRPRGYDPDNIAGWLAANGESVPGFTVPEKLSPLVKALRQHVLREENEMLAGVRDARKWFLKAWYFPRFARRQQIAVIRMADGQEVRIPLRYVKGGKKIGRNVTGETWRGDQIQGEIAEIVGTGESSMFGARPQRPGTTPPFRRHREYGSLQEFLDAGEEPMTWDLIDQLVLRRIIGQQYRDQKYALDLMKESGRLLPAGTPGTEGWIKPPWPAADPLPFIGRDGTLARSPSLVMSPEDWESARYMFPSRGVNDLGGVALVDDLMGELKKTNLVWSLFQHIDIGGMRALAQAVTEGRPAGLVTGPKSIALAFSPQRIRALYDVSSAGNPWKQVLRSQGLGVAGGDIVKEEALAALRLADDPLTSFPFLRYGPTAVRETRAARALDGSFRWFQEGLFDYTYRVMLEDSAEAMLKARIRRTGTWQKLRESEPTSSMDDIFGRWMTENTLEGNKYAAEISRTISERFSSKALWQRAFKGPAARMSLRLLRFGPVEMESLLGYALKPILGPRRADALKFWGGAYLGFAAIAEALNLAFSGQHLGRHQLTPIRRDPDNPLGVAFNSQFLRPDLGPQGEGGRHLYADLLGQLDYPLRIALDPYYWLRSGLPPLPATVFDLQAGTDVVGNPVELPGAIPKLFMPINLSGWFEEKARIGVLGSVLQTLGINVSAETIGQIRERIAKDSGEFEKYPEAGGKFEFLPDEAKARVDANEEVQQAIGVADAERLERVAALSKDKKRDVAVQLLRNAEGIFETELADLAKLPAGTERGERYRTAVIDRQNGIALARYTFPQIFEEWDEDEYDPDTPSRNLNVRKRQEIFEKYRDPVSLKIPTAPEVLDQLFDELEEFEAELTPSEVDDLYKDIGSSRPDWVREEQAESRYIREQGWWDRHDILFSTISAEMQSLLAPIPYENLNYREARRHIADILRQSGVQPTDTIIDKKIKLIFPKGEEFLRWIGTGKDSKTDPLRERDPKLEAYLLKHGKISCVFSDKAVLAYRKLTGLAAAKCERAD